MLKKLTVIFVTIFLLTTFSVQVFAAGDDIFNPQLKPTDQFLVKLFNPEFDSSTFNTLLLVSGVAYEEDVSVQLGVYNEYSENYEHLYTIDGVSNWETDGSGLFFKELNMKQGVNKIRIAAYKTSMAYDLVWGETLQISDFNITVLSEETKKSFFMSIMDIINKFY